MISSEWAVVAVVFDVCREWSFKGDEPMDMLDPSLSDCAELLSTNSSGMDSVLMFGEWLAVEGLNVQGMDSFIRSSSFGVGDCASHSSSFLTTQGFCLHRSFERYALHAWLFERGWPWSRRSSRVVRNSMLKSSTLAY